ncbi:MAG TPA: hypothetical protein VKX25_11585 [Bryobacteraceae bacterium]|jgi:hypothetical protein|nr:hypothetical protein [Bryobacteraceae bacterium]
MNLPRFVHVRQSFPNRAIPDIPRHVHRELAASGLAGRVPKGARVAVGVGSRGISNIATITRAVIDFWKSQGANPFLFPAMGSHGAATAEGQADVLAHYGIHEATMGVPVLSSLDVVSLGATAEGIETFVDRNAFESDGIFLIPRIKWHTDFVGPIESGMFKMMAIGLGKFSGAQNYHTHAYKIGLERMIRSVGERVFASGKVLGGLAIQEGAHHETAGLVVLSSAGGCAAMLAHEEKLLAEVKSWKANVPADPIDVLIVDEMGKNISGAGMDTKVINRSVYGGANCFADVPRIERVYVRGLTDLTYGSAVGVGLADVIHDRLLEQVDWNPTYINSLTASTPLAIQTPIHFASDAEALAAIAPTVGKHDLSQVTYCRIRNTMELMDALVSENLLPQLNPNAHVISEPFAMNFDANGDFELIETPPETLVHA